MPITGREGFFCWTSWIEVSAEDFVDISDKWHTKGRESTKPYKAALANELPTYPLSTLGLEVMLRTSPLPDRPTIEIVADHLLRHEQVQGISPTKVEEIAHHFLG